jgi:hypothetical protein
MGKHDDDCRKQKFPCCEDLMCPCDLAEFERMQAENARLREALEDIAHCIYGNEATFQWVEKKAREALRGDITPDKGGE